MFGYTAERVAAEYSTCKEPLGHEGKARQIIMEDLIKNNNWIRIRYTPKFDSWVIEMRELTSGIRLLLTHFFSRMAVIGKNPHATVVITELFSIEGVVSQKHIVSALDL